MSVAIPIALVIALVGYFFRDQAKRVANYFRAWQKRDEELELEERHCRENAMHELGGLDAPVSRIHPEDPQTEHEETKA